MKKILLGSCSVLVAGLTASPAFAAGGIKLGLGGFFRTAVEGVWDNHGDRSTDLGANHYNDSVDSDGEIYFTGKTTLDNGLTVGARVELEAEQWNDQIDAAYAYFQGGFGEVRLGSTLGALGGMCVTPVGGTTNFGAFTQNQMLTNANNGLPASGRNVVCRSVDGVLDSDPGNGSSYGPDKSQKIMYISPSFGGFQLALSWAPNGSHESTGVTDFHSGQPTTINGEQRNIIDAYATFTRDFGGWGVQWGGGGSWALDVAGDQSNQQDPGAFYQSGLNLSFGNLSVGGAFEYLDNGISSGSGYNADFWTAGGGIAYKFDAFTAGFQYSHNQGDYVADGATRKTNTVALTGKYAMGPGITLDAALEYTWSDGQQGDAAHGGYHSIGAGLGTAFTF